MAWTIEEFAGTFFEPLVAAATDRTDLVALIEELGWRIELEEEQAEAVRGVMAIAEHVSALTAALPARGAPLDGQDVETLYRSITGILDALKNLGDIDAASLATLPAPLDDKAAWKQMALDIPEYLTVTWLAVHAPAVYEGLHFAGVIVETEIAPDMPPRRALKWDQLTAVLTDPNAAIAGTYDWGGTFAHARFLVNLSRWLGALGVPHEIEAMPPELGEVATAGTVPSGALALHLALARLLGSTAARPPGLALVPASRTAQTDPAGIAVVLTTAVPSSATVPLGSWTLSLSSDNTLAAPAGIAIDPAGVRAIGPDRVTAAATLAFGGQPVALFGTADGCRLEIVSAAAGVELSFGGGAPDARVTLALGTPAEGGLRLVIAPGAGDSFVAEVLGADELAIDAGLSVAWSGRDGVTIEGGLGFEVIKPLDIVVGPLHVDRIRIALFAGTDGIVGEAAVSGGIDLGVLALAAEDIGIRVTVEPAGPGSSAGSFGSARVTAALKPPDGFGIAIDLGGLVTGGGYLAIDHDAGRYAGVAQVGFAELGLTAIGIIETKVPGIDGWSMFFSVFSEFPPIQLSFGFTLNGVGGLLGVNRTLDFAALEQRLLGGALDSVMFPEDPVANAPAIIEDLSAVFPPAPGQFLFGVMCKIGWGPRTIVEANLGVIVELPDPIRIALLGQVSALLPDAAAPAVELHMDVAGLADLTAGTLALNAVLRDSHIAGLITLSGAMALRAELLDRPNMLLSVGGFHPAFNPPAGFPTLDRVRAQLPVGDLAMVSLAGYVAVTSNTFQTGGRLDVWVELSGFTAEGFIAIDALIVIDPFGFAVQTAFGVTVRAGSVTLMGVEVSARLQGPSPFEIHGEAAFEILGFEKTLDVHITTGRRRSTPRAHANVAALVAAALAGSDALVAESDEAGRAAVRRLADAPGVDPAARLSLTQKVAPLGRTLDHVGGAVIDGARRVAIDAVTINGAAAALQPAREWFAPAQYFTMRDAEKLKAPSFEEMDAGVSVSAAAEVAGASASLIGGYDEFVIDRGMKAEPARRLRAGAVRPQVSSVYASRFTAARRQAGQRRVAGSGSI